MFDLTACPNTCSVSGVLNIVLRISKLLGIAPLNFTKKNGIWYVKVAPILCIVGYVITTVINVGAITGLVLDLTAPRSQALRTRTPTRKFVWITDFFIVMLSGSFAGYRAPVRLRNTVSCLEEIQKLNVLPPEQARFTRKARILFIMYSIFTFCLLTADYEMFINDVVTNNRHLIASYFYVCYYCGYIMLIFVEMQYIFSALEVTRSIKYINDLIEEISLLLKSQNCCSTMTNNCIKVIPRESVNRVIDLMGISQKEGLMMTSTPKSIKDSISRLASKYSIICDVVRQMNQSNGVEILSLLLSFLLHLVITPYNLIVNLYTRDAIDVPVVVMQVLWCGLHFSCTVAVVEPSYRTQREVERTDMLISQMIIKSSDELVSIELEKFSRYLLLNKITYSPMGICTLGRSIVASIVGSVATYLVIIVQFQLSEP